MRFQHWFPESTVEFAGISTGVCNATLAAYQTAWSGEKSHWLSNLETDSSPTLQLCRDHASCILNNTSEYLKAGLSTAGVVLGLLPTILAVIAPSMSELALLSERRTLLAVLLAIGAPGTLQTRVFSYEDPAEVLEGAGNGHENRGMAAWIHTTGAGAGFAVGLAELVVVTLAFLNTIVLAAQLSNNSILAWGCERTWPVFVWVFVPFVVHALAAVGYRLTLAKKGEQRASEHGGAQVQHDSLAFSDGKTSDIVTTQQALPPPAPSNRSIFQRIIRRVCRELQSTITAVADQTRMPHPSSKHSTRINMGILLNSIGGFLGFLHLLFGTVTFSGLLFIVNLDALGQVAIRLMASCIVCRLVTMVEMTGLRSEAARHERGNAASVHMVRPKMDHNS